ncbi:MAG: hypothetical protein ACJA1P_002270, partial [Maribacter sp.]
RKRLLVSKVVVVKFANKKRASFPALFLLSKCYAVKNDLQ